ncbi:penicillin-binding protein 1A [Vibrio cholerae]|nr:penicillin-binding protein 1A [Vibrio cholerae]
MFEYFEAGTEPTEYVSEHVNESIYSTSRWRKGEPGR